MAQPRIMTTLMKSTRILDLHRDCTISSSSELLFAGKRNDGSPIKRGWIDVYNRRNQGSAYLGPPESRLNHPSFVITIVDR